MRNKLKLSVCFLCILLLFQNCEKDDVYLNQSNNNQVQTNNLVFKIKNLQDYKEDLKFIKSYQKLVDKDKTKNQDNILQNGRAVMEDQYGFTIDSTNIKEVSYDNKTSYTFLIERDTVDDTFFENLVLEIDSANTVKAILVKYINNTNISIPVADNSFVLDATIEVTNIDYDNTQLKVSADCFAILMCPYGDTPHPAGQACKDENRGDLYYDDTHCDESDAGGINTGNTNDGNPNSNENSGTSDCFNCGGSGSNGTTISAITLPKQPWEKILELDCGQSFLGIDGAIVWLQNNKSEADRIYNYLTDNCNEAAEQFANQAIIELMNDGEVDFEDQVIYDISLTNYPCQKDIVEDMTLICEPLSELFQTIFVDSDETQLTFKAVDLGMLDGGYTVPTGSTGLNYEIGLNVNRLTNSTNLDIISTVVHEYTHATLLYFFHINPSFTIDLNNPPSYASLVQMFSQHREQIGTSNETQHTFMIDLVDDMVQVCLVYCQQNNIQVTPEQMTKICWGGLDDTTTYDELFPDLSPAPSPERDALTQAAQSEIFPNVPGENPVGTQPCN
ncbi:hypothetical protein [Olleya sp. R77988]|uniref:hypothetical protein n=1 Tax=Olleya sp. R77988 TaxID=3093875 RepID=UPI0037C8E771